MANELEPKIVPIMEGGVCVAVLVDGVRRELAARMDDTDRPSYEIDGSRYVRVPRALEVRTVSNGSRLQVSCPELRGLGNFLGYTDQCFATAKTGVYYLNFNLDTPEFRKQRSMK